MHARLRAITSHLSRTMTTSPTFSVSEPLSRVNGQYIKTAAALVIGDEVLNGKTLDRNSNVFARWCFTNGIQLKRIEVIADDEDEIVEASRRMAATYDFVVTSGGIGPTHDDITYPSLAAAFDQPLVHHAETLRRMQAMMNWREETKRAEAQASGQKLEQPAMQTPEQIEARERMALFPKDAEVLFVGEDIWVPVIRLAQKVHILPGIPSLFQRMLEGLTPLLPLPPSDEKRERLLVFTNLTESSIAPFLTSLQARVHSSKIQIGSYPTWGKGVYVSIIGSAPLLADLGEEVAKELQGNVMTKEEMKEKREKEDAKP